MSNLFEFISQLLNQIFRQLEFFHQVRFFVCRKSSIMRFTVFKALEDFTSWLLEGYIISYDSHVNGPKRSRTKISGNCTRKYQNLRKNGHFGTQLSKNYFITSVWLISTGLIWKKVCLPLKNEIKVIKCWVIFAINKNLSIKIIFCWTKVSLIEKVNRIWSESCSHFVEIPYLTVSKILDCDEPNTDYFCV